MSTPAEREMLFQHEETALMMCAAVGLHDPSEDEVGYMATVAQAFDIYRERERDYGGMWKDSGSEDNATQIRSKAQRMLGGMTARVKHDSALDCINYAVFYFRNVKAGR